MIVVRNTFRLKFGKAKEAMELVRAMRKKGSSDLTRARIMTDVTGNFYTFVLEFEEDSLASWESNQERTLSDKELRPYFEKLYALVESGHREIFKLVV